MLDEGELQKAGEFVWGSMAAAVKAVAACNGVSLRSHGKLVEFARELSRELESPYLYDSFHKARSLHSNFYEADLTAEDVHLAIEDVRGAIGFLMELIPRDILSALKNGQESGAHKPESSPKEPPT